MDVSIVVGGHGVVNVANPAIGVVGEPVNPRFLGAVAGPKLGRDRAPFARCVAARAENAFALGCPATRRQPLLCRACRGAIPGVPGLYSELITCKRSFGATPAHAASRVRNPLADAHRHRTGGAIAPHVSAALSPRRGSADQQRDGRRDELAPMPASAALKIAANAMSKTHQATAMRSPGISWRVSVGTTLPRYRCCVRGLTVDPSPPSS